MSQGLQLAIFTLWRRADDGIKHVGMYCVAGGPDKASYRKTNYTPTTYMNISSKAQGIRMLWTQFTRPNEPVSFVPTLYHRCCLLSALLNSSQLALSISYLWEMKQAPNRLLTCWKKDLCCLTTQLAPTKLANHLLWITVQTREERTTALVPRLLPEWSRNCATGYGETKERRQKQLFRVHIISEIVAAAPAPYTCKHPSIDYSVLYTHTVTLPIHPPPNTHTYTDTHAAL